MSSFSPNNPSVVPPVKSSTVDAVEINLFNSKIVTFNVDGSIEIDGVFVERIVQVQSFVKGQFVTIGSPWILSLQTSSTGQADGIVIDSNGLEFFVCMIDGSVIDLPSHGKGSVGVTLWGSGSGNTTTSRPNSGNVFQRVARVKTVDEIVLKIEHPVTF